MMDLSNEQKKVQKAMNASLSGLQADPWLAQRVLANAKGEEPMVKKVSGAFVVLCVLLILSMATAVAAGVLYLGRGLDAELQITEEIRETYQETELFDAPDLSVTQNGVTVKVDECIVDERVAYLAFRVTGYQPEPGQEPTFTDTKCTIDEERFSWCAKFSNGLVTSPDGRGVYPDGSVPEDYGKLSYLDENGELIYIISLWTDDFSLIGRTICVKLTDLGIGNWGEVDTAVEGDWTFEWELKGSAKALDVNGLNVPIGKTGSTFTSIHLSPIHVQMTMNVPRKLNAEEEDDTNEPYFYGIQLKDGTRYLAVSEGGSMGYVSADSDEFHQLSMINRIIDPEQVEALLFTGPAGAAEIMEVPIQ